MMQSMPYELSPALLDVLADGSTKSLTDLAFLLNKSPETVKDMIARGIESGTLVNLHKGNGYKVKLTSL